MSLWRNQAQKAHVPDTGNAWYRNERTWSAEEHGASREEYNHTHKAAKDTRLRFEVADDSKLACSYSQLRFAVQKLLGALFFANEDSQSYRDRCKGTSFTSCR